MAIAFIATITAQMGAAWINCNRSKAHGKKMAELQRAYEEKVALGGIENARAEFAQLCAFQREIEKQSHLDRLNLIRDNHEQILIQDAYENSLRKWTLLVPPYVIASVPLTLGPLERQTIPLNCILTTSSDLGFNNNIFHKLEEQVALFCSKYWNVSFKKSIRFFQESWRDDAKDLGSRYKDIYAHLKSIPTLLISPVLKNNTLLFRFYWWGLSSDPSDAHIDELNELNPELSIPVTSKMRYDDEVVNLIIRESVPKLEAFISFFADIYYANYYHISPSLPELLYKGIIKINAHDSQEYLNNYTQLAKGKWMTSNEHEVDTTCEIAIASFKGIYPFLDKDVQQEIYFSILSKYFKIDVDNSTKASDLKISLRDFDFVRSICAFDTIRFSNIPEYSNVIESLENDYSILDSTDTEYLSDVENHEMGIALYRLYQIFEYSLNGKYNPDFAHKCLVESSKLDFVLAVVEQKVQQFQKLTDKEILSLEVLHNSNIQSASILLAKCYFWGLGVIQDEEIALNIINSNKGPYNSEFYYNVAMLLIDIYGEEEQSTIMSFLRNASKMGYVKAMEKLMMIYKGTKLSKEDPEKHFLYAKQAAEHGSIVGLVRTGYCYAMGYGVPKSISSAKSFLTIAARHGSENAKKILTILTANNG